MAPRIQPGNPQWLEWVEAVAVMHEEKGSKAAQTYKKVSCQPLTSSPARIAHAHSRSSQAARSFRQCPVTFTHPDESSELVGVGPGVIKIITSKLKEQCERTGEPFPERRTSRPSYAVRGSQADSSHMQPGR